MADVNLTAQQEKIANHIDGPMIVLAGAGSGKTATLIKRTGRLIDANVSPRSILLMTFSRKAAKEIKLRLIRDRGYDGEDVFVDTFHGFGYRFLRQYKEMFGLTEDQEWVILSENEQNRMRNEIGKGFAEKVNADPKEVRKAIKSSFGLWSLMKQSGICPGNVSDALMELEKARCRKTGDTPNHEKVSLMDRITAQTLVQYEKDKRAGGYLDYDDLLLLPARALKKYPEVAKGLAMQHQFIMVDESQDTNAVQYWMTKAIAEHHGNLILVGDDDQGIYSWRGARVANLRRFIEDFKAPITKLEQNFRSHSKIVSAANQLIRHNRARLAKQPFSENQHGELPQVMVADRDRQMADQIVEQIVDLHSKGTPLNDMAVLYRTNRMTTILEPALKQARIPYTVVGGMSFYERSEIQAACALVRMAVKWDDWLAVKSLQPYIDGLGTKGMNDTIKSLQEFNETVLSFALHQTPAQFGKGGIRLQSFLFQVLENTHVNADTMTQVELVQRLVQWMKDGPMRILDREKDDAVRVKRSDNLDLLIEEIRQADPPCFMEYLMEGPISDYVEGSEDQDKVTLSTIHRSKGLEWPHVMIAGASDGLMPLDSGKMSGRPAANEGDDPDDDGGKPEEERRLAYVAATRAASSLTLYHADLYHFPGSEPVVTDPSPFIQEMGLEVPEVLRQTTHWEPDAGKKSEPHSRHTSKPDEHLDEDNDSMPFPIFG